MAGPTALATPDQGLRSPRTARKGVGTPTDKLEVGEIFNFRPIPQGMRMRGGSVCP